MPCKCSKPNDPGKTGICESCAKPIQQPSSVEKASAPLPPKCPCERTWTMVVSFDPSEYNGYGKCIVKESLGRFPEYMKDTLEQAMRMFKPKNKDCFNGIRFCHGTSHDGMQWYPPKLNSFKCPRYSKDGAITIREFSEWSALTNGSGADYVCVIAHELLHMLHYRWCGELNPKDDEDLVQGLGNYDILKGIFSGQLNNGIGNDLRVNSHDDITENSMRNKYGLDPRESYSDTKCFKPGKGIWDLEL